MTYFDKQMLNVKHPQFYLLIVLFLFVVCSRNTPDVLQESKKPDIILISIESLRYDHVSYAGYKRATTPTLDQLAAEGAIFTNAVSTTSWTLPAHASLFTGLYNSAHGVHKKLDQGFPKTT